MAQWEGSTVVGGSPGQTSGSGMEGSGGQGGTIWEGDRIVSVGGVPVASGERIIQVSATSRTYRDEQGNIHYQSDPTGKFNVGEGSQMRDVVVGGFSGGYAGSGFRGMAATVFSEPTVQRAAESNMLLAEAGSQAVKTGLVSGYQVSSLNQQDQYFLTPGLAQRYVDTFNKPPETQLDLSFLNTPYAQEKIQQGLAANALRKANEFTKIDESIYRGSNPLYQGAQYMDKDNSFLKNVGVNLINTAQITKNIYDISGDFWINQIDKSPSLNIEGSIVRPSGKTGLMFGVEAFIGISKSVVTPIQITGHALTIPEYGSRYINEAALQAKNMFGADIVSTEIPEIKEDVIAGVSFGTMLAMPAIFRGIGRTTTPAGEAILASQKGNIISKGVGYGLKYTPEIVGTGMGLGYAYNIGERIYEPIMLGTKTNMLKPAEMAKEQIAFYSKDLKEGEILSGLEVTTPLYRPPTQVETLHRFRDIVTTEIAPMGLGFSLGKSLIEIPGTQKILTGTKSPYPPSTLVETAKPYSVTENIPIKNPITAFEKAFGVEQAKITITSEDVISTKRTNIIPYSEAIRYNIKEILDVKAAFGFEPSVKLEPIIIGAKQDISINQQTTKMAEVMGTLREHKIFQEKLEVSVKELRDLPADTLFNSLMEKAKLELLEKYPIEIKEFEKFRESEIISREQFKPIDAVLIRMGIDVNKVDVFVLPKEEMRKRYDSEPPFAWHQEQSIFIEKGFEGKYIMYAYLHEMGHATQIGGSFFPEIRSIDIGRHASRFISEATAEQFRVQASKKISDVYKTEIGYDTYTDIFFIKSLLKQYISNKGMGIRYMLGYIPSTIGIPRPIITSPKFTIWTGLVESIANKYGVKPPSTSTVVSEKMFGTEMSGISDINIKSVGTEPRIYKNIPTEKVPLSELDSSVIIGSADKYYFEAEYVQTERMLDATKMMIEKQSKGLSRIEVSKSEKGWEITNREILSKEPISSKTPVTGYSQIKLEKDIFIGTKSKTQELPFEDTTTESYIRYKPTKILYPDAIQIESVKTQYQPPKMKPEDMTTYQKLFGYTEQERWAKSFEKGVVKPLEEIGYKKAKAQAEEKFIIVDDKIVGRRGYRGKDMEKTTKETLTDYSSIKSILIDEKPTTPRKNIVLGITDEVTGYSTERSPHWERINRDFDKQLGNLFEPRGRIALTMIPLGGFINPDKSFVSPIFIKPSFKEKPILKDTDITKAIIPISRTKEASFTSYTPSTREIIDTFTDVTTRTSEIVVPREFTLPRERQTERMLERQMSRYSPRSAFIQDVINPPRIREPTIYPAFLSPPSGGSGGRVFKLPSSFFKTERKSPIMNVFIQGKEFDMFLGKSSKVKTKSKRK